MPTTTHVGIDLAWNVNARTGLAVVDDAGALVAATTLRTDDEIVEWLDRPEWAPVTVAVDAPLIVTNTTGQRECERLVSKHYHRYNASCYPSNLSKVYFNPPRGGVLAGRNGWNLDPNHRGTVDEPVCIEVYPHAAMVGLFELGSVLPYKAKRGRTVEGRREVFVDLLRHLETIATLRLANSARWAHLRAAAERATRQVDLERIEDEIDAILCAHLAWLWSTDRASLEVYGEDVASGYIVAPPPPMHPAVKAPTLSKAADVATGAAVEFWVGGEPATYATGERERRWKTLVVNSAVQAGRLAGDRYALEIDFILPTARPTNDRWDIDNLIKPVLDSIGDVIGFREWTGTQQVDDERVDEIHATKRTQNLGEQSGAQVRVSVRS